MRAILLGAKILAAAVYVGGLTTVLGLWVASNFTSLQIDDPRRTLVLDQVGRLMVFLVVPALLIAIVLGIFLLMKSPRQFLSMRWLQVKLISLAILIPSSHFFCKSRFNLLRAVTDHAQSDEWARQLTIGFTLALLGSMWVLILGRHKPRLWSPRSPQLPEPPP